MQRGLFNHIGICSVTDHARKFYFACILALLSSGCYQKVLTPLERYLVAPQNPPRQVDVNFCTDPAVPEKFVVKTVIIFDHSGSNKLNYLMRPDGSGLPLITNGAITSSANLATDPTGILRYGDVNSPGSLLQYLSTLQPNDPADPTRYFASVNFSNNATTYPPASAGFTSDIPDFYQQMRSDAYGGNPAGPGSPDDSGATSYLSALQAAYNIINSDIVRATNCSKLAPGTPPSANCPSPGVQVASSYVVIFASDGAPILSIAGVDGNGTVTGTLQVNREPTTEILGQVQTLVGLTSNKKFVAGVNLFSVYYWNPNNNIDNTAQSLLAEMARVGNGVAYRALSGSKIDFTRFQPPARTIKYLLSDLFVTNTTGAWDLDGQYRLDTDSDGLSDAFETQWGSNINQKDTNGNGVSDMVELQLKRGAPCGSKNAGTGLCQDAVTNYRTNGCGGISYTTVAGKIVFRSSDPNGLNDCEKVLLADTGGINNPDSNGDGVPDWLAFKNGVPFQLGSPAAYLSTVSDGYTQYQKVKFGLPVQIPLNQVLNYKPTRYSLTQISNSAIQACYKLVVNDLPYASATDKVRVEIVQRSELLQDRYLYRTAEKTFSGSGLIFNDWKSADEIAAGTWGVWQ